MPKPGLWFPIIVYIDSIGELVLIILGSDGIYFLLNFSTFPLATSNWLACHWDVFLGLWTPTKVHRKVKPWG